MTKLLYLLPSWGALIGLSSVLITYCCLWLRIKKSKTALINSFKQKLAQGGFQNDFREIVDDKLEGFIADLRAQIPMGAMLFSPALSQKIKELAKEGVIKMIPDIKERVLKQLSNEINVVNILWQILRPELIRIMIYAALLGFILGMFFIYFVNF